MDATLLVFILGGDTSVAGLIAVPKHVRALDEVAAIQVNFCRMPTCPNFGKPSGPIKRGRGGMTCSPFSGPPIAGKF
jgi:hypothetical protein